MIAKARLNTQEEIEAMARNAARARKFQLKSMREHINKMRKELSVMESSEHFKSDVLGIANDGLGIAWRALHSEIYNPTGGDSVV